MTKDPIWRLIWAMLVLLFGLAVWGAFTGDLNATTAFVTLTGFFGTLLTALVTTGRIGTRNGDSQNGKKPQ